MALRGIVKNAPLKGLIIYDHWIEEFERLEFHVGKLFLRASRVGSQ